MQSKINKNYSNFWFCSTPRSVENSWLTAYMHQMAKSFKIYLCLLPFTLLWPAISTSFSHCLDCDYLQALFPNNTQFNTMFLFTEFRNTPQTEIPFNIKWYKVLPKPSTFALHIIIYWFPSEPTKETRRGFCSDGNTRSSSHMSLM